MLTCSVELQGRQDLCGLQLRPECWNIKASSIALCMDTLQEHGPGSTDQVHQSVLRDDGGGGETAENP